MKRARREVLEKRVQLALQEYKVLEKLFFKTLAFKIFHLRRQR